MTQITVDPILSLAWTARRREKGEDRTLRKMAQDFKPRLDILPPSQHRLWGELSDLPEEFTLYGGTAIALHLGHRASLDFDFFSTVDLSRLPRLEPVRPWRPRGPEHGR